MDRKEVLAEVRGMFGEVPDFIRDLPDSVIGEFWSLMKNVEMSPSALSPKQKELIGLAVAATTHCKYCTYFHTEAAKLNGASKEEIDEAILMGRLTNLWSTYLNGSQIDFEKFKKQVDESLEHARKAAPVAEEEPAFTY